MDENRIRLIVLFLVYLASVGPLVFWLLTPPARKLFIVLSLLGLAFGLLFLIPKGETSFWSWFFDPNAELAAGATFSSIQLLAVGLLALALGWRATAPRRRLQRAYWWPLAAVFIFLSLDEYYELHESILWWRIYYGLTGGLLALGTLAVFGIAQRADKRTPFLILLGLAVMGMGGVAFELFSNNAILSVRDFRIEWFTCRGQLIGIDCLSFNVAEEFFEIAGVTLVLAALLAYGRGRLDDANWQLPRRLMVGGSALWALWLLGSLWIIPSLQGPLLAQPARADFLDGALSLVRYSASDAVLAPGDELDVTLYLRANEFLDADYSLSIHLFTQPVAESVAQADLLLGEWKYPTRAWLPGLLVRNDLRLQLPDDLPAPRSYWLVARLWQGDWPNVLLIGETDLERYNQDTLILESRPVLAAEAAPAPQNPAAFHFDDAFTLTGYALPADETAGEALNLRFWWQTEREVNQDLTQFVHFFHRNGEDVFTFDQPPFDSTFPTADWPGGMTAVDDMQIDLPADLPPGEYDVRLGMYDSQTRERLPITDGDGQPVTDHSIVLGTLRVSAP